MAISIFLDIFNGLEWQYPFFWIFLMGYNGNIHLLDIFNGLLWQYHEIFQGYWLFLKYPINNLIGCNHGNNHNWLVVEPPL